MRFLRLAYGKIAYGCVLAMIALLAVVQADQGPSKAKTASGTFVSFKDGTLTLRDKSGLVVHEQIGANYKTFQNNENGPGVKQVPTVEALSQVLPGTVCQVHVEDREISIGLDHRVIGTFESYQDGKLDLLPADAPAGFLKRPTGRVVLAIDPGIPVLESVDGSDYRHAGSAGEVLKNVRKGTMVTARSEYDTDTIEVIQLGDSKRKIERYVGQTRGTVRGGFVSFRDGILRIRGKGVTSLAANEYERLIAVRITDSIPVVESIDGGAYRPADPGTLKSLKEGTVITVRKVEEVVLEIQIGVAR
jgi:hypothetical protein